MEIKDLQKIMQDNGVVGAGGAGFPYICQAYRQG